MRAPRLFKEIYIFLPMEEILTSLKRTISARSISSSSESSSPTDKRPKSSVEHIEECESLEDADILILNEENAEALSMASDLGSKLDEILIKLKKLDTIEETLNDVSKRLAKVESTVGALQAEARAMDGQIKEMDKGLSALNEEVEEFHKKIEERKKEFEELHTKQLYLESYSRRENLKFFGVAEKEVRATEAGEAAVDTRDVLYGFMEEVLGLENPRVNIEIQRVHRIGKSVGGKPKPILARFLRFQDREKVLRAGFNLKETEFMVLQDFPQEIIERRRKQMPKLKEAKQKQQRVSFSKSEPDKLFINGKFIPM